MTLLNSPQFDLMRPYIFIEDYSRDGGHKNPRFRIELRAPLVVMHMALDLRLPCVACGHQMSPFRVRSGTRLKDYSAGIYYAAACPLSTNISCSRGAKATQEYMRVRAAVLGRSEPKTGQGNFSW